MKKKFNLEVLNKKLKSIKKYPHDFDAFIQNANYIIEENTANDEDEGRFYANYDDDGVYFGNNSELTLVDDGTFELTFDISNDPSNCGMVSIYNFDLFLDKSLSSYKRKQTIKEINKFLDLFQEKTTVNTAVYTCLLSNKKKFNDLKSLKFVTRSKHINKFRTRNKYYLMTRDVVRP